VLLVEADGDFDKAIENLRKRTKVAANRSDRESTEGAAVSLSMLIKLKEFITLNCETDFVGKMKL
jgi:elongation factor Ts